MYTGETKISLWGPYTANLVYFSGLVVFSWFILRGKRIIWVFCLVVFEAAHEVYFCVHINKNNIMDRNPADICLHSFDYVLIHLQCILLVLDRNPAVFKVRRIGIHPNLNTLFTILTVIILMFWIGIQQL